MRITQLLSYFALATSAISAASLPVSKPLEGAIVVPRSEAQLPSGNALEKRKGGGGKGGGGGGGGGSKSGSGSGGGGAASRTSSGSTNGGSTRLGSGSPRSFGGGKYYGGGAATPYSAGGKTPKGRAAGALLLPATALLLLPGIWLYSVYPYHLNPYRFHNATRNNTNNNNNGKRQEQQGVEETLPVTCLCQEFSVCGCDDNDDASYIDSLVGNGSYTALNKTLVNVADENGTKTLVINGTLPNGTTAPGGSDDEEGASLKLGRFSGYWVMVVIVLSTVAYL